jgi:hypothetical protein
MNLIQAFVWNVGTSVLMLRKRSKWRTHKDLSTKARHWGGLTRISEEAAEKQWSEGVELSVLLFNQPMKVGRS